ncbi:hypothetical protein CYY_010014, partial [Polysphondylium violaceum]
MNKQVLIVFLFLCIFNYYSLAENKQWITPSIGYYHDGSNWNTPGVPLETDRAFIQIDAMVLTDAEIKVGTIGITHPDAILWADYNVNVTEVIILSEGSLIFASNATYAAGLGNRGGLVSFADAHYIGVTVNENFVSIKDVGPTFYSQFQNHYYTSIESTIDKITSFGGFFYSNDTFVVNNTNTAFYSYSAFENGYSEFKNSAMFFLDKVICNNAIFEIENSESHYFYQLTLSSSSLLNSLNSSYSFELGQLLVNDSTVRFTNDIVNVKDSLFGILGTGEVIAKNSNLNLLNSSVVIGGAGSLECSENSNLDIKNGTAYTIDQAEIEINHSNFKVDVFENEGFVLLGNSSFLIKNESTFLIDGVLSALNYSRIDIVNSQFTTIGHVLVYQNAKFLVFDCFKLNFIKYILGLADNAVFQVEKSKLQVDGLITLNDNSRLALYESELIIPGDITIQNESTLYSENSNVLVQGSILSESMILSNNSIFNIQGSLGTRSGITSFHNSTVNVNGNLLVLGGVLLSTTSNVTVQNNVTVVLGLVLAQDGSFIIENGSLNMVQGILHLNNTQFKNSHGVVYAADIEIYAGTTFVNDGKIVLSSNIMPSNESDPSSTDFKLENIGEFIIEAPSSNISVPMVNSGGSVDLKNNTVYIKQYSQNQGKLLLKGGFINSDTDIVVSGG